MLKKLRLFVVLAPVILTTACAGVRHNHIDQAAREHFDEVQAYLAVPQDEIYAEIDRSQTAAAAGGGLLFAIIDSAVDNSRTKSAEELIKPIRNNLIDYDYAQILKTNIESKITTIDWLNVKQLELERSIGDNRIINKMEKSNASAVLFITAEYKIAPDFDAIQTNVALIMFPNVKALKNFSEKLDNNEDPTDKTDNIYRNDIVVNIPLGSSGNKASNAQKLSESNSAKLREALDESANRVAMRILEDILLDEKSDI